MRGSVDVFGTPPARSHEVNNGSYCRSRFMTELRAAPPSLPKIGCRICGFWRLL
jgi:hypothetical protein